MPHPCPVCLHDAAEFTFEKAGYTFARCRECEFLFTWPFPSEEQVKAYYNRNYRSASEDFYPKISSRLRRAYVKSIRFIPYLVGKDAIDIGCGGGAMAHAFSIWGARAHGLDISAASIAYARKHFTRCVFYCESLKTFRERGLKFDFVFSTELLEHLPGPDEFMLTLRVIARPGCHVYIATPDSGHETVPRDISQWNQISPPEHLQFFNRKNIEILFGRYGFALKRAFGKQSFAHSLLFKRSVG